MKKMKSLLNTTIYLAACSLLALLGFDSCRHFFQPVEYGVPDTEYRDSTVNAIQKKDSTEKKEDAPNAPTDDLPALPQ